MNLIANCCFCLFFVFLFLLLETRGELCGVPIMEGKILGGIDSGGYHYPWFSLLLLKQKSFLPVPVCGGSLISSSFVLSAAHCFTISPSIPSVDLFVVALGVYDICDGNEPSREIFGVANVAIHEKYQRNKKFFDIALVKLQKSATYTTVCLPISGVPDLTEAALLIGFGVTADDSNSIPCHMMEVNVTKYSKMDCRNTQLPVEDKEESSVICAGDLSGKADSCYGDSGGPLHTRTPDGRLVVAGIVSYGYGCGTPEVPGVYTNVGSYINWIEEKMTQLNLLNSHGLHFIKKGSESPTRRGNGVFKRPHKGVIFSYENAATNPINLETQNFAISHNWFNHSRTILNEKKQVFFEERKNQNGMQVKTTSRGSKVTFPN